MLQYIRGHGSSDTHAEMAFLLTKNGGRALILEGPTEVSLQQLEAGCPLPRRAKKAITRDKRIKDLRTDLYLSYIILYSFVVITVFKLSSVIIIALT